MALQGGWLKWIGKANSRMMTTTTTTKKKKKPTKAKAKAVTWEEWMELDRKNWKKQTEALHRQVDRAVNEIEKEQPGFIASLDAKQKHITEEFIKLCRPGYKLFTPATATPSLEPQPKPEGGVY